MKTICFFCRSDLAFRSLATALFVAGLQLIFLSFPIGSLRAWGENDDRNAFNWKNLQSDIDGVADRTDPNLVNSWGLALNTNSNIFWVADNGTGVSTLYAPNGTPNSLIVTIPKAANDTADNAPPTGIVFNPSTSAFFLPGTDKPAAFIFDAEDGAISAWNPMVNLKNAIRVVDNSPSGAVYKGLALLTRQNDGLLYATNFSNGTVDVFKSDFTPQGQFRDPSPPPVPNLNPASLGWAPFGIAHIGDKIYVTFALQNGEKHDDVGGAGHGFVDIFNLDGTFNSRLINPQDALNSPWGLARVPHEFGKFNHDVLLVGNFGDGHINAFDIRTGQFLGALLHRQDQPLAFNGLWALFFFHDRLYFTAGIVDEGHGLFGFIRAAEEREEFDK